MSFVIITPKWTAIPVCESVSDIVGTFMALPNWKVDHNYRSGRGLVITVGSPLPCDFTTSDVCNLPDSLKEEMAGAKGSALFGARVIFTPFKTVCVIHSSYKKDVVKSNVSLLPLNMDQVYVFSDLQDACARMVGFLQVNNNEVDPVLITDYLNKFRLTFDRNVIWFDTKQLLQTLSDIYDHEIDEKKKDTPIPKLHDLVINVDKLREDREKAEQLKKRAVKKRPSRRTSVTKTTRRRAPRKTSSTKNATK